MRAYRAQPVGRIAVLGLACSRLGKKAHLRAAPYISAEAIGPYITYNAGTEGARSGAQLS